MNHNLQTRETCVCRERPTNNSRSKRDSLQIEKNEMRDILWESEVLRIKWVKPMRL